MSIVFISCYIKFFLKYRELRPRPPPNFEYCTLSLILPKSLINLSMLQQGLVSFIAFMLISMLSTKIGTFLKFFLKNDQNIKHLPENLVLNFKISPAPGCSATRTPGWCYNFLFRPSPEPKSLGTLLTSHNTIK